ncbi:type II secretion system F family protein [Clostridium formicaceticum]|uniref:Type II secretion system protein F n=1 Tax=Clostridium formicaceticum TaxID=1497 RepID=A0AAC9RI87_9CLOT|nr:type II secretion system F family protein [Clostridium formicaceticum]AOY77044.1 type II secretion system protein F [Clostridium formicaceticum]ARE87544.1 Type II secretion system protein F [Clostridium formicaceticum]
MASTFKYKAVTSKGEAIEGSLTAESKDEVIRMIRQNQQIPVKIEESKGKSKEVKELTLFKPKVKVKDLTVFCKQFYTMLNAGMSLTNCLEVLIDQTENKTLKVVIGDLFTQVQKGAVLSEAMKKHKKIFPTILISMVEAGELTGTLDEILGRMSEHFEKEGKINAKIKGAMMYPLILSIVAIGVVIFLLVVIMPTFIGMFTSSGVALPLPTRMLLAFSNALTQFWYVFMFAIVGTMFLLHRILSTDNGKRAYDKLKFKIPIIKGSITKIITSRFTRTLSSLLSSGIPIISALEASANVTNNKVVIEGIEMVVEDIRKGVSLAVLLKKINIFPPMMISMVSIGEESGSLDTMLSKTADFYDQELEAAIQQMVSLLEPIMIVVMAVIIGFIVIAMMLPMFDMMQTI